MLICCEKGYVFGIMRKNLKAWLPDEFKQGDSMKKIIFVLLLSCLYSSVFANAVRTIKVLQCSSDNQSLVELYLNVDTSDDQKPVVNYTMKITGKKMYYGERDHEADCVKRFAKSNVYLIKNLHKPLSRNVLTSAPNCPFVQFSANGDQLEIEYNRTKTDGSGEAEQGVVEKFKGCFSLPNYQYEYVETLD